MSKDLKALSSWVRQLRHRAKKHNLFNSLSISEIQEVIDSSESKCCLCGADYAVLDMAFPLKDGAPNVQANVIILCDKCKDLKRNEDLLYLVSNDIISKSVFAGVLKLCFNRNHSDVLITHVKALSGNSDD